VTRSLTRFVRAGVCLLALAFFLPVTAHATVVTFNSLPPGTVVAGDKPGGGTEPGTVFPFITLAVTNTGGGPHSLIIFDSSNPSGNDPDLGTPNTDFAGPGVGNGGKSGMPGQNDKSWGHLLIVAEDIVDGNNDGLVDDPDDEAGGGSIQSVAFAAPIVLERVVLVDVDGDESGMIDCYLNNVLVGSTVAQNYGNNSVQEIFLGGHGLIDEFVITLSSSGAIAELEYNSTVKAHTTTWGKVKSLYAE